MTTTTLVTGNPDKLRELQQIVSGRIKLTSHSLDLPEIQSLDLQKIVEDKAKRAYAVVNGPVIIDDVSVGLDGLAGLPGPFYKFFCAELGDVILLKLAATATNRVTVRCLAAYYDGHQLFCGEGVIQGAIVEPRGEHGFGFDPFIVPDGSKRTLAELRPEEKNAISHRGQALRNLVKQLEGDSVRGPSA